MKLRNYTFALLAVCALASCAKEDVPEIEVPDLTPDATLSIVANSKIGTRAGTGVNPSEVVSRLTVLVFTTAGEFQSMADSVADKGISLTEIKDMPVRSGMAKVLVIANRDMAAANGKSLTEVLAMTTTLDQETHKPTGLLTMSSQVFDNISIIRGKYNCMGYENNLPTNGISLIAPPINLYRSVARVQLSGLALTENTEFGVAQSFQVDSVFVANVKSISKIASIGADGTLESDIPTDEATQWWSGGCPDFVGEYKKIAKETEKFYLGYSFNTPPTNWDNHPYYDTNRTGIQGALTLDKTTKSKTDSNGIGNFFYVYENSRKDAASMTKDGTQTVLVLKGTYTYIPKGSTEPITMENRYYTTIVNDGGTGITYDKEVNKHTGIRRNYQYNLNVTIIGPGSETPYDKDAWAWVKAQVEVLPWGVIKIEAPDAN